MNDRYPLLSSQCLSVELTLKEFTYVPAHRYLRLQVFDPEPADDGFHGWTSAIWRETSRRRGVFVRLWCLFVSDYRASRRDCDCGRTVRTLILGDPPAFNMRLEAETSGQVKTLLLGYRSANWAIEIERRIIGHWRFSTAFRPSMMVNFEHFSP